MAKKPMKPTKKAAPKKGAAKKKNPGFQKVAAAMAKKQGVSGQAAAAELAASTRKASAKAKKQNPSLKKVK